MAPCIAVDWRKTRSPGASDENERRTPPAASLPGRVVEIGLRSEQHAPAVSASVRVQSEKTVALATDHNPEPRIRRFTFYANEDGAGESRSGDRTPADFVTSTAH